MRWGNLHNIECSCSCSSVTVSPAVVTVFNVVPVCCKDYIICCFVPVIVVKFDVAAIKEDSVIIQLHLMIYTPSTLLPSQQTPSIPGATSRFYTITKQFNNASTVISSYKENVGCNLTTLQQLFHRTKKMLV